MSGHSKWHNIRLKKGKMDAERGKVFTKLAREIIVAAKEGGGNPDGNLRLRLAIQKARENSMPKDNIQRAIKRGTGELEGVSFEEVTYEGYGPAGVAVMVSCLTDNRNRTVADIRHIFSRCGGNLGESGCVAWMFDSRGMISIAKEAADEDTVMAIAIDAGAEDVRTEEDTYDIITNPEDFHVVRQAFENEKIPMLSAELTMLPKTTVVVEGKQADQVLRLMEMLEDHDDVQNVYANFDIPAQILEAAARQ